MKNPHTSRELVYAGIAASALLGFVTMLGRWWAEDLREHLKSKDLHPAAAVAQLDKDVLWLRGQLEAAQVRADAALAAKERREQWDANQQGLRDALVTVGAMLADAVREVHGVKPRREVRK